jgi:hypothetical protein
VLYLADKMLDCPALLDENCTVQAACKVEWLNAEEFLEVLLGMHPQVFVILVSPSATTQSEEVA